MTTEDGVVTPRESWKHIEHLRRRLEFMRDWIADGNVNLNGNVNHYYVEEIRALEWAIPILEAEADWIRDHRLYTRDVRRVGPRPDDSCPACGAPPRGQRRKPDLRGWGA